MTIIRPSQPSDYSSLLEIWATAVDATHDFLSKHDRNEIEMQVRDYLTSAPLFVAADRNDQPLGFLHVEDGHIHALFVHADHHGAGVGRRLIEHVVASNGTLRVDVNEQNERGVGFYRHLGFSRVSRSPTDSDGRPYPILHLEMDMARPLAHEDHQA